MIAEQVLDASTAKAAETGIIAEAVSDAEGFDPAPRATLIRASPPDEALQALLKRNDLGSEPATHYGLAFVPRGEAGALVVLLSVRKTSLQPFPRTLTKPGSVRQLCGQLAPGFGRPEAYVTRPDGRVDSVAVTQKRGTYCTRLAFPKVGQHVVEIIARAEGARGRGALLRRRGKRGAAEVERPNRPLSRGPYGSSSPRINALRPSTAEARCAPASGSTRSPSATANAWRGRTSSPTRSRRRRTCASGRLKAAPILLQRAPARTSDWRPAR